MTIVAFDSDIFFFGLFAGLLAIGGLIGYAIGHERGQALALDRVNDWIAPPACPKSETIECLRPDCRTEESCQIGNSHDPYEEIRKRIAELQESKIIPPVDF